MTGMEEVEHAVSEYDAAGRLRAPRGGSVARPDLPGAGADWGQSGSSAFGLKCSSLIPKIGKSTRSV